MKKICALVLTLVFMFAMATSAFAVESPEGEHKYTVKTYVVSMVTNETSYQWYKVIVEGDTIKLIVDDKYIDSFVKWEILSEYDIVSGSLTDKELVIRPKTDLDVFMYVNSKIEGSKNDSGKSPDTSAPIAGIAVVMALAACTAVVAKKQLSK